MLDFEEMLYSFKLPEDIANATKAEPPYEPKLPLKGLADVCTLFNITSEKSYEKWLEDCDQEKPYDCPVPERERCLVTPRPLDFIYERHNDTYNLTRYESDSQLLKKIRTGKGDTEYIYTGPRTLNMDMYADTEPKNID